LLLIFSWNLIFSQQNTLSRSLKKYNLSSGSYDGSGLKNPTEVFKKTISFPEASWIRIKFRSVNLGKNSYIVIEAVEDSSKQILNSSEIEQWNYTSAYFNGDSLMISLFAGPGDQNTFFIIDELFIGKTVSQTLSKGSSTPNGILDVCGSDDRVLSNDKAVGRIITEPSGTYGTGFILFNGRIATAGHVLEPAISESELSIIEFNVPTSGPDGSIKHADAIDQYTFKRSYIIDKHTNGEGDDWAIFYTNTNNGLGAKERQNCFFYVEQNNSFQTIQVTGYGQANGNYNHAQKTSSGQNQNSSDKYIC